MSNLICPFCDNSELEIWEVRKSKARAILPAPKFTTTLEIAAKPDEHEITHVYCEQCDPAHGTNLVHLLNGEIDVQFLT